MTTNSTTPRTDALAFAVYNKGSDYAREHVESLARTLERELAAQSLAAFERIHELKRDNARLRGALTVVANSGDAYNDLRTTARAALATR